MDATPGGVLGGYLIPAIVPTVVWGREGEQLDFGRMSGMATSVGNRQNQRWQYHAIAS